MTEELSKKKKTWIIAAILVLLYFIHPWIYIGLPINGVIIDSSTKKPLEGVLILASWELTGTTWIDTYRLGQIHLAETITNAKGEYRFPFWVKVPIQGSMNPSSPVLTYYKNGYHVVTKINPFLSDGPFLFSSSDNDGKTINLKPFEGSLVEYAEHLRMSIANKLGQVDEYKSLGSRHNHQSCVLSNVPRLMNSIWERQERINQAGVMVELLSPQSISNLELNCGTKVSQ